MSIFIITLCAFLTTVALMAIGVVIAGKKIQGSCGGLANAVTNQTGEKVCGYCGVTYDQQKISGCGNDSEVKVK